MPIQSLYRRYRPQKFSEIVGQSHVVNVLKNAVVNKQVGHAYLFSGPRGTGKTSTARILAKALNCEKPKDGEPCGKCETCVSIEKGKSFDLMELDAASNNGVDAIRELVSMVAIAPIRNYKVYVIDEVHMLSSGAENALLKTLEEPPEYVIFVMATTEPHKVVETVRSRAQHLEFGLIKQEDLAELLKQVNKDAKLDISESNLEYILKAGGGSARDALSVMDQVAVAGAIPERQEKAVGLVEAIVARDTTAGLNAVGQCVSEGGDLRVFVGQAVDILRNAFLVASKVIPEGLPKDELELATSVSTRMKLPVIVNSLEAIGECMMTMRSSPDPRVDLEVAIIRLTRIGEAEIYKDINDLLEIVTKLQINVEELNKKESKQEPVSEKPEASQESKSKQKVSKEKPSKEKKPKEELVKEEPPKEEPVKEKLEKPKESKEPKAEKTETQEEPAEELSSKRTIGALRKEEAKEKPSKEKKSKEKLVKEEPAKEKLEKSKEPKVEKTETEEKPADEEKPDPGLQETDMASLEI